jgi:hypothetical protein
MLVSRGEQEYPRRPIQCEAPFVVAPARKADMVPKRAVYADDRYGMRDYSGATTIKEAASISQGRWED